MDIWTLVDTAHPDQIGFLADWVDTQSDVSFVDQIDENYQHGGGWRDVPGFILGTGGVLTYPEDPPMEPIAMLASAREILTVYDHAWVCVFDLESRTWRVSRID